MRRTWRHLGSTTSLPYASIYVYVRNVSIIAADLLLYGIPDRSHGRKMQGLHLHLRSHVMSTSAFVIARQDFSSFSSDGEDRMIFAVLKSKPAQISSYFTDQPHSLLYNRWLPATIATASLRTGLWTDQRISGRTDNSGYVWPASVKRLFGQSLYVAHIQFRASARVVLISLISMSMRASAYD